MKTLFGFFLAVLGFAAFAAENQEQPTGQAAEKVVVRVVTNVIEKIVEKPVEIIVEKFVNAPVGAKPVEKIVEKKVYVDRPVEKVVTNFVEKVRVERLVVTNVVEKIVEKPVQIEKVVPHAVEKVVEKPVRVEVERVVTNTVEKIIEKPVEVEVEKIVTNVVEKIVEKPVRVEIEKIVTNTVEKVVEKNVHDFSEEERLRGEVAASVKKSDALEAKNTFLSNDNEKLKQELAEMRERCQRLERLIPKGQAPKRGAGRQANITSKSTYYDRKEGFAVFDGKVHVDDERYQLHADKAYVFMDGTNNLKRLVAMGNVALTNETKRAYGVKASYYRQSGMVILYGDANRPAEVRDEAKYDDQSVIGEKIKFWIDKEQVEVIKARVSAPVSEGAVPFSPKF